MLIGRTGSDQHPTRTWFVTCTYKKPRLCAIFKQWKHWSKSRTPPADLYLRLFLSCALETEPQRQKTYFRTNAPSEHSDQYAHSYCPIGIFTLRFLDSQCCKLSSCGQWRFWSDCAHVRRYVSWRFGSFVSWYAWTCLYILRELYSRISIAQTPMARLPWLIWTRFWVLAKFFR